MINELKLKFWVFMENLVFESLDDFMNEAKRGRAFNRRAEQEMKELRKEMNTTNSKDSYDALLNQYQYGHEEAERRRELFAEANRKQHKNPIGRGSEKFINNAF